MLKNAPLILVACLGLMLPAQSAVIFDYGSSWKYFIGTNEASLPDTNAWRAIGFDDSGWSNSVAPIGYGETNVVAPIPTSAAGNYLSVYFRKTFVIKSPTDVAQMDLSIIVDDGAWLGSTERRSAGRTCRKENWPSQHCPAGGGTKDFEIAIATNLSSLLRLARTGWPSMPLMRTPAVPICPDASLLTQADEAPPTMVATVPVESAVVSELSQIEVFFDESVTGVSLADLLINGSPIATNLTVYSPRDYLFEFPQPPNGSVNVTWAPGHGIIDLALTPHAFAGASWSYTLDPNIRLPKLVISECMADNQNGIKDEDGSRADWLEIYNPGPLAENLEGWFLTDTTNNLTKWRFPSVPMAANSYLLVWASEKNRTNPAAPLHTNFKLEKSGEYLALVNPQTNVVSAFYPAYPPQEKDVSYGRDRVDPSIAGYFTAPTPRAQNSTSGPGFAPEPVFSLESGLYTNASLTISLSAASGVIRYTLDGSVPTNSSPAYASPIVINAGTVIKARVFQTGLLPSRVVAKTYHLLDATTRGFSSNLPLLIINTSGRPIGQDTATRTRAFVALLDAHRGRTSMQTEPDFQGLAGIEVRGQTSSGFPKTPYNLEINDEFGNDLAVPLLDLPADSDWALRNPYSDKCMMNDFLALELHEKMGHYAVRRRFVEVFVDANGGKLVYPGDYRGIYVLLEKIKVDKNRLDLAELTTSHTNEPAITGGYIVKKDKSSPGDVTFSTSGGGGFSGQQLRYHEPKPREITTAQKNWIRNYLNQFERALYAANWLTATGTNHYSWYIDVDSFVDQHWIVEFTKQIDGYRLSNYMHKDRGGKLKMDPIWDWNLSFGNADYLDGGRTNGWYYTSLGI